MKVKKETDGRWHTYKGAPKAVEMVEWEDTETHYDKKLSAKRVRKLGLGRVWSVGLRVRETKKSITLVQSFYAPSDVRYSPQVSEAITIPKALIKKRTVFANVK